MDNKDLMKGMIAQDLGHCGAIASSALTLAAERSHDIGVPLVATFLMLKTLCERNIQVQMDVPVSPHAERLAKAIGKDSKQIQQEGIEALESVINKYFEESGGKRVDL